MDPLTHALAGAAAARVTCARSLGPAAWLPGVAGALLPDVDALARSGSDPLLYAEFHRHVTHALAFVPAGALIAALPWLLRRRTRAAWPWWMAAAGAGCATHGLLDAATTYGTSLWWPFSDARVAWNAISIVDPVFTLVLLIGALAAVWRRSAVPAAVALVVCGAWLGGGVMQRDRAHAALHRIAAARGHVVQRSEVFPAFGTTLVWRSLYDAGGVLYMDRIRVPWAGEWTWRPGASATAFRGERVADAARDDPRIRRDIERFHRFSRGWVAQPRPDVLADARYSDAADRFEPVWGVRLVPGRPVPVEWVDRSRQRRLDLRALWAELSGRDPAYRPVGPPSAGRRSRAGDQVR